MDDAENVNHDNITSKKSKKIKDEDFTKKKSVKSPRKKIKLENTKRLQSEDLKAKKDKVSSDNKLPPVLETVENKQMKESTDKEKTGNRSYSMGSPVGQSKRKIYSENKMSDDPDTPTKSKSTKPQVPSHRVTMLNPLDKKASTKNRKTFDFAKLLGKETTIDFPPEYTAVDDKKKKEIAVKNSKNQQQNTKKNGPKQSLSSNDLSSPKKKAKASKKPAKLEKQEKFKLDTAVEKLMGDNVSADFTNSLKLPLESSILQRKFLERDGYCLLAKHLEKQHSDQSIISDILHILSSPLRDKKYFTSTFIGKGPQVIGSIMFASGAYSSQIKQQALALLIKLPAIADELNIDDFNFSSLIFNAIEYYNYKAKELHKYQHLIQALQHEQDEETKVAILKFINVLLIHSTLEDRIGVRMHLQALGLAEIISKFKAQYREGSILDLVKEYEQLSEADEDKYNDLMKKISEIKLDWTDDATYNKLCNSLITRATKNQRVKHSFYEVLRHLLSLQADQDAGLQRWQLIERFVTQLSRNKGVITLNNKDLYNIDELLASKDSSTSDPVTKLDTETQERLKDLESSNHKIKKKLSAEKDRYHKMEKEKTSEIMGLKRQLHDTTVRLNQDINKLRLKIHQLTEEPQKSSKENLEMILAKPQNETNDHVENKDKGSLHALKHERVRAPSKRKIVRRPSEVPVKRPETVVPPKTEVVIPSPKNPETDQIPQEGGMPMRRSRLSRAATVRAKEKILEVGVEAQQDDEGILTYTELIQHSRFDRKYALYNNTEGEIETPAKLLETSSNTNDLLSEERKRLQDLEDKLLREKQRLVDETNKLAEEKRRQDANILDLKEQQKEYEREKSDFEANKKRLEELAIRIKEQRTQLIEAQKEEEEKRKVAENQIVKERTLNLTLNEEMKSLNEKIKVLESSLQKLEAEKRFIEKEKVQHETNERTLEEKLRSVETSVERMQMEKERLEKNHIQQQRYLTEQKAALKSDIDSLEQQYEKQTEESLRLEKEKVKLDTLQKSLTQKEEELIKERRDFLKNKEKFLKDIEVEKNKLKLKDRHSESSDQDKSIFEQQLNKKQEELRSLNVELGQKNTKLSEITKDYEKLSQSVQQLRREKVEQRALYDEQINKMQLAQKEATEHISKSDNTEISLAQNQNELDRLIKSIETFKLESNRLMQENDSLRVSNGEIEKEREKLQNDINNLFIQKQKIEETVSTAEHDEFQKLQNSMASREQLIQQIKNLEVDEANDKEKYNNLIKKIEKLEKQYDISLKNRQSLLNKIQTLEEELNHLSESKEQKEQEIDLLQRENTRLNELKRQKLLRKEELEKEISNAEENEKKAEEALKQVSAKQVHLQEIKEKLELDRKRLLQEQVKLEEEANAQEEEASRLRELRHRQEDEADILEEEIQYLTRKRRETAEEALELDEEAELLDKKKKQVDDEFHQYQKDLQRLKEKKQELENDKEDLEEEKKWLEEKRVEHIEDAKQLDEERKWLQEKRKELEKLAEALDDVEEEEEADPVLIEAFEKALEQVRNSNIRGLRETIQNHSEIVNFVDAENDQNTLLHWAALVNCLPIAKMLIDHGAEQYENSNGKSPFDLAEEAWNNGRDGSFFNIRNLLKDNL